MSHFKQVMFTISKEHDIYIDEVLLNDKRKDKKEFSNGRSEYIRKLINDDMNKNVLFGEMTTEVLDKNGKITTKLNGTDIE